MQEATINPELLDILAGRHCCACKGWEFPIVEQAIAMGTFAIEGKVMWEVWVHKHFWREIRKGNASLNPYKLFQREYVN